ncbi:arylsulfatase J-like [Amphiura filiformis]|uniref:arylsulfatase J-like n=1 Tax=Amphiura filiformis TaxID=82378 RepID=UPI003B2259E2
MSIVFFRLAILVAVLSAVYICLELLLKAQEESTYIDTAINGNRRSPPHVVFILVDDLGYNDVGYNAKLHGSAIRTPNIDKLASHGVILDNYYVHNVCTPTRAQLLTGRYPIRYGLQHHVIDVSQPSCLPSDEVTLADELQDVGYSTHAVGKWHLGFYKEDCLPTNRGFETFFGMYSSTMDHYTYLRHDTFPNHKISGLDLHNDTVQSFDPAWDGSGHYSTELLTREAQKVIKRHATYEKPLFLYLSYMAIHDPIQVPERYKEPYKDIIANEQRLTLAGMINSLDEGVGNLTETLKESGLYDNTIIIFSTDNGGSVQYSGNNWPFRESKNTLYEGGVRGVGFIHSPLLPDPIKGTTSHAWIHVTDWFPTILSGLAGRDTMTKAIDGIDVWKAIISNSTSPRKELLHSIDPISWPKLTGTAALQMGDWKLLLGNICLLRDGSAGRINLANCAWYPPKESNLTFISPEEPRDKKIWLFNIARDPLEKHDLATRRPGIVKRMMGRLRAYNETAVPPWFPPRDPNSNPKYNGGVWGPWE